MWLANLHQRLAEQNSGGKIVRVALQGVAQLDHCLGVVFRPISLNRILIEVLRLLRINRGKRWRNKPGC
jgi:hypothetical protein